MKQRIYLTSEERQRLVNIIASKANEVDERLMMLENANLEEFISLIDLEGSAKKFADRLVRYLQNYGLYDKDIDELPGEPALFWLIKHLITDFMGHPDDVIFLKYLLQKQPKNAYLDITQEARPLFIYILPAILTVVLLLIILNIIGPFQKPDTSDPNLVSIAPPVSYEVIETWLEEIAVNNRNLEEAREVLLSSGFLNSKDDWQIHDYTGDGNPEWTIIAKPIATDNECRDLYIVEPQTQQFLYSETNISDSGLDIVLANDVSGDGITDLLYRTYMDSNCEDSMDIITSTRYYLLSFQSGKMVQSLRDEIGNSFYEVKGKVETMENISIDPPDINGNSNVVFIMPSRNIFPSEGPVDTEGIVMQWTEDVLKPIHPLLPLPDTDVAYFILMRANKEFDNEEYERAKQLYQLIIRNEYTSESNIIGSTGWIRNEESELKSIQKYALVRLTLIWLHLHGHDNQYPYDYIRDFPGDALYEPLQVLSHSLDSRYGEIKDLSEACTTFRMEVEGLGYNPFSPLDKMGTANPILDGSNVCPF